MASKYDQVGSKYDQATPDVTSTPAFGFNQPDLSVANSTPATFGGSILQDFKQTAAAIPKVAKSLAKSVVQIPERAALGVLKSIFPESVSNAEKLDSIKRIVGDEPIEAITTKQANISNPLKKAGLPKEAADSLGWFGAFAGTALDLSGVEGIEKDAILNARKLGATGMRDFFSQSKDVNAIEKVLTLNGQPFETARVTATNLAKAGTAAEVDGVIKNEAPALWQRFMSEDNSDRVRQAALSGEREAARLTDEGTQTVYRAGTKEIGPGDFVTSDITAAEKYASQREGAKIFEQTVPKTSLVKSDGVNGEFVFAPKETPTATTPVDVAPPQHFGGSTQEEINTSIDKLTQALKEVKPLRAEQEAIYTAERSKRLQKVLNARETAGTGEAGFHAELSQLKGELPKVQFESLRKNLDQGDVDNLFKAVVQSNRLTEFEKISARQGLAKMFGEAGGSLPTNGEIGLLSQVLPKETVTALMGTRDFWTKAKEGGVSLLNLPRAILATGDLSAPFRQGLFLIGKPKEFASSFVSMFKQFGSDEAFKAVQESIFNRPSYHLMKDSKLALTDVGADLSQREERFLSNMVDKIPGFGKLSQASNRAYVGFLNKLRADVFDNMVLKAAEAGVDAHKNSKVAGDIASFINNATGRGGLGPFERSAGLLNGVLFSPRLLASRVNLLNPYTYMKLDPVVRKEAIKTMLASSSMLLSVLGLAKLAGAEVGTDPTSADFAKIKVGNTRLDIGGGIQQYLRLGAQLITGKTTSSTTGKVTKLGEGYKPMTKLDLVQRFFMGKENPVASLVTDKLAGHDLIGQKFKLGPELLDRLVPLLWQDMHDTVKENGIAGLAALPPAVFGVGVQTYKADKSSRKGGY